MGSLAVGHSPAATPSVDTVKLPASEDGDSPINFTRSRWYELDLVAPKFSGYDKKLNFYFHREEHEGRNESQFRVKNRDKADAVITIDGITYELVNFHFHAPGEHQLEGAQFPLEAHFVHKSKNKDLAVIGLLFKLGKHNPNLQRFIDFAQKTKGIDQCKKLKLKGLLPTDFKKMYYRYHGSLTTPPYRRGVKWMVRRASVELSQEQLTDMSKLGMNLGHRDVQEIGIRAVVADCTE
jgi:carbonic anhydrase